MEYAAALRRFAVPETSLADAKQLLHIMEGWKDCTQVQIIEKLKQLQEALGGKSLAACQITQ